MKARTYFNYVLNYLDDFKKFQMTSKIFRNKLKPYL